MKYRKKSRLKNIMTMKLNEKEFVDRLHDVESQLQCLKLLDHHKTKY